MRIIIAYNYDPSNLRAGGGITYVHNLLKGMLDEGIRVILLGVKLSENQSFKHENLEFIPILEGTDNWWKFLFKLRNTIKSLKLSESDIIHTHHPLVMRPFIKAFPKNPKICTFHGVPLDWVKVNYPYIHKITGIFYKPLEKNIIKSVNKIITPGEYTKTKLNDRYLHLDLDKKISIIPSSIDINKFVPMNKSLLKKKYNFDRFKFVIIFVGRLAKIKNPELLIKSYYLLKKEINDSSLLIIGRGENEEEFKNLTKKLNLKDVIFYGEAKAKEVIELLNCSDVLALTSWYESSPTVVKEALSCGIPVITTNVGDVKTIITNKFLGEIVDSYDEYDYSKSILRVIKLVKDKPLKVKNNCRGLACEKFSSENMVKTHIKIYDQLINEN